MKKLILLPLALLSFGALADSITPNVPKIVITTSAPTFSSIYIVDENIKCLDKEVRQNDPKRCAIMSTVGVLSTTTYFLVWKEEIAQVQPDMHAFLAGEEMTLALEEVLKKARENSSEISEVSDEELTVALITLLDLA